MIDLKTQVLGIACCPSTWEGIQRGKQNILPAHPRITVSGFQFMVQALSELYIFTRIGDEYVRYTSCPLSLKL